MTAARMSLRGWRRPMPLAARAGRIQMAQLERAVTLACRAAGSGKADRDPTSAGKLPGLLPERSRQAPVLAVDDAAGTAGEDELVE